jgi:zinc/manganese transport system substrate-binding protein
MISKTTLFIATFAFTLTHSALAAEKLKVVTSIPDLAWVAAEVGGERVEAVALLRGTENPHFVDAVPEFTRLVADADIVCIVGLDLEVGYMPPVLARSGNANIQPGGKGYCEAGKSITVLEKPVGPVDRSMGDVHPSGNPHFYLSPKALTESAKVIAATLQAVDPGHTESYQLGLANFTKNMLKLSEEIYTKLKPIRDAQEADGKPIIMEYHREFTYFLQEYGLKSFGSVEEKPGVPPSAGRLGSIALNSKSAGVLVALAADYNPSNIVKRFTELSGIEVAVVPTMIQPKGTFNSYAALQRHIAEKLVASSQRGKLQN